MLSKRLYLLRGPRTWSEAFTLIETLVVIAVLAIIGGVIFGGCGCLCRTADIAITLDDDEDTKYTLRGSDGGGTQYRINATTDEGIEVFVIHDSWGQRNSADLYRQLKRGKTYDVKVRGFRSGWMSRFRNIIQIYGEVKR